ncbi:MAG: tRNA (N6-isopentenyl adenosine(37)-C2)-methylthiotransferase MiaB [Candidatus Eremiobacteraeota bacterium]|nr:tRNA (N6-isopentenyl adenosine(37)-C2)-methylthiotransferase MiaB [Candidatus Eremiobacteraeota bacterium]MBC5801636.1 tRNA (N6-isopentenyl adenosine(37)-C2)-methylthiotransferase MiaB [Candidatus Eremiobacteraeota bacterium]
MNEADSQYIADRAAAAGYAVTAHAAEARVVVLNTCTVRENAERRAYGRMAHFRALKAADPDVKLVVCGCLAEQDRERMQQTAPYLDGVFGTSDLTRLGDALEAWRPGFRDDLDLTEERLLVRPLGGQGDCVADAFAHLRAYVNVQRGCSYYCTYCIVPYVRGRFDNRPSADILGEIERALSRGAREITLVGQTVNAYKEPATGADFADLLAAVAALPGLDRLTFLTSHPKDFTPKLARAFGSLPHLQPRFHLPVQCGSDAILRRMNRKYSVAQYREKIALFREQCAEWALTTDLIVAFPGETDDDFGATLALCEEMAFAQAFMFVYSPRRGTPAARWEQIPPVVGNARLRELAATVDHGVRAWHERKRGRVARALVQGPSRKDPLKLAAKTADNVTVVAPRGDLGDAALIERPWLDVRIDDTHTWGCTGEIVATAARFDAPAVPAQYRPTIDLIASR